MGRKILSVVLSAALLTSSALTVLPQVTEVPGIEVQAASSKVWSGKADTSWYKKSQTSFKISTAEQLAGLAKLVREGDDMTYEENGETKAKLFTLTADIILNDTSNFNNWISKPPKNNWTPIGVVPKGTKDTRLISTSAKHTGFSGVFDGNGHTIKGLYCDHDCYGGLFATVNDGAVLRTIIKDAYIKAENDQTKSWDISAGGITGVAERAIIAECEFDGKIIARGLRDTLHGSHRCAAGGIVGRYDTNTDWAVFTILSLGIGVVINPLLTKDLFKGKTASPGIYSCINRGDVFAEYSKVGDLNAGGITGYGLHEGGIKACVNFGKVSTNGGSAGGLAGETFKFKIIDSYYTNVRSGIGKISAGGEDQGSGKSFANTASNKKIIANKLGDAFTYASRELYLTCRADRLTKYPTSVKLNKSSLTLGKGETYTLTKTLSPSEVLNKGITWTSSNTKAATVTNGKITAKSTGTTTITATTANGKKATCKVTVKNAPSKITLNKKSLTLNVKKTYTLKKTLPANSASNKITYTTSNKSVATVSTSGKITAKKAGTATITVKTFNGKTAKCKVTVKTQPTSVKLNKTSVTLKKGKSLTLKATVKPTKYVTSKKVTWKTSNNKIATVKNGKVTAKKAGTVTITVKTTNGKTAKCKVKVTK